MTRAEREQLIERYLREELTPSEEHDFFIEAATDKELRFDLKASRVLENAFRKDRKAAPSSYAPMRNHLAEILAGSHVEQASCEEVFQPAEKKSGAGSPLGWIVTAASIGLIALTSLLIGIVAIDRDEGRERDASVVMERKTHNRENGLPSPSGTHRETSERSIRTIVSGEKHDPDNANQSGSKPTPLSHPERSRAIEERPQETSPVQPSVTLGGPRPENIPTDTTDPDTHLKFSIETPEQ